MNITITAFSVPVLATCSVFDAEQVADRLRQPVLFLFFSGFALAAAPLRSRGLDTPNRRQVMQLAKGHLGWAAMVLFTITAALSMWISNAPPPPP